MIDHWFGRLLDAVDETGIADDTAIVLCTDHGHFLGEKDIWGKPGVPHYEPLGRIPLLVQWPGVGPGVVDALTTSVDLHATIADLFGVTVQHRTHGRSLLGMRPGDHHCFHLDNDPGETDNRLGSTDVRDLIELLRVALREVEAPPEQLERLGLA